MLEISERIYTLLNVATITVIATGGIWPLIAEQEKQRFITYAFSGGDGVTKDRIKEFVLEIGCYDESYNEALKMHDAVQAVLEKENAYLTSIRAEYLDETKECVVYSTYRLRLN